MNDQPAHPDLVRLRAELLAARSGLGVLGELEGSRRDRVVADLLTSVPDAASRAARAIGPEVVVAEVRRFPATDGADSEGARPVGADSDGADSEGARLDGAGAATSSGAPAVWSAIAQAAVEAATAVYEQA